MLKQELFKLMAQLFFFKYIRESKTVCILSAYQVLCFLYNDRSFTRGLNISLYSESKFKNT